MACACTWSYGEGSSGLFTRIRVWAGDGLRIPGRFLRLGRERRPSDSSMRYVVMNTTPKSVQEKRGDPNVRKKQI